MLSHEQIRLNIRAHDALADRYEEVHEEIFNDVEQARLRHAWFISVRIAPRCMSPSGSAAATWPC